MYKIGDQIRGIAGYADGYGVDELGKVYTFKQGRRREVRQHDHKGYQRVFLFRNNERKAHFVHRLVAEAFIKNTLKKEFVNHKDGNKRHNKVTNLEWCTREENQIHSREVLGNTGRGTWNANYGYKKSKFYPSENLRSHLIELGVPRNKHDIVSLGEMLSPNSFSEQLQNSKWVCTKRQESGLDLNEYADTEANARAAMLIYLIENGLISKTNAAVFGGKEI